MAKDCLDQNWDDLFGGLNQPIQCELEAVSQVKLMIMAVYMVYIKLLT